MSDAELMSLLLEIAGEAGIEVRSAGDADAPPMSGVCRVRGKLWVVLSRSDPVEIQVDTLAGALADHASPFLEGRFIAPVARARIESAGGRNP